MQQTEGCERGSSLDTRDTSGQSYCVTLEERDLELLLSGPEVCPEDAVAEAGLPLQLTAGVLALGEGGEVEIFDVLESIVFFTW